MQRAHRAARPGCQYFFNEGGRAFCLYAVIGSYAQRAALVPKVNAVLATVKIAPSASGAPTGSAADDDPADDHDANADHHDHRPGTVDRTTSDLHDNAVSVLAGPFVIASALLALGGAFKAIDPDDTAHALRSAEAAARRAPRARGGAAEVVIGVGALAVGGPVFAALVALSYLAFAGFVVVALRAGSPISSCGCFGKVDTPPSSIHVVIDLRRGRGRDDRRARGRRRRVARCARRPAAARHPLHHPRDHRHLSCVLVVHRAAEDARGGACSPGGTRLSVAGQEPQRPSRGIAFTNWLVSRDQSRRSSAARADAAS